MPRRAGVVAALIALVVVLSGCSAKDIVDAPAGGPHVDVATKSMVAEKTAAHIEDCPATQVAHGVLPNKTLRCLGGGRSVDMSTLKGPLVLNFWQGTCAPCRREMPALAAFHKKYPQVPLIGVDTSEFYVGVALRKAVQYGVTYPLLADPDGLLQGTSLSVTHIPSFFFLTASGKLIGPIQGGLDSVAQVKAMVDQQLGLHL